MALGPLTNVAIGMLADPELCRRLEHLYIMGGNCEVSHHHSHERLTEPQQGIGNVTSSAEFNFHADPEAAAAVLERAKCPVTIAPWELSYKHNFVPLQWRKQVLGSLDTPCANLINKIGER